MIKKLLILVVLMLLSQSSISQVGSTNNEYPKLYISETGDSLVLITLDQVQKLNIEHVELLKYKELSDSLNEQIIDYEIVVIKDNELIDNLQHQLKLKSDIALERGEIIDNLEEKNNKTEKKLKKNLFFNKTLIIAVTILGILVLI